MLVPNTNAIISSQGGATGSYAAGICADYSVTDGGVTYNDWYLPSEDELNQLYINRAEIGGFASNYFWSSTESSIPSARVQHLDGGNKSSLSKAGIWYVRAVRTF